MDINVEIGRLLTMRDDMTSRRSRLFRATNGVMVDDCQLAAIQMIDNATMKSGDNIDKIRYYMGQISDLLFETTKESQASLQFADEVLAKISSH